MYELVLLVHVFIYGFMVAVILGYDWNVSIYPIMVLSLCYTNDSRCYNP